MKGKTNMNNLKPIHPGNLQCFLDCYRENLKIALELFPEEYHWSFKDFDSVILKMNAAIERGSFNKDSRAIKATCKQLKINHTYKAIKEFISL
jgi:hypothetical protein